MKTGKRPKGHVLSEWEKLSIKENKFKQEKQIELYEQSKKHHHYCWVTYLNAISEHVDWKCSCHLLKAYDEWRKDMR